LEALKNSGLQSFQLYVELSYVAGNAALTAKLDLEQLCRAVVRVMFNCNRDQFLPVGIPGVGGDCEYSKSYIFLRCKPIIYMVENNVISVFVCLAHRPQYHILWDDVLMCSQGGTGF